MTGVSHYPAGTNAFQNVPPRGVEKPLQPKRIKINKPKAVQAAISLETPEERQARLTAKATEFVHFAGINQFGVKPDHMAIETKSSKLTGKRVRLGRDI